MSDTELHDLTLSDAAEAIAEGKLSPVEYTAALIARSEALQPQLDAFITPTFEAAMADARAAEDEIAAGNGPEPYRVAYVQPSRRPARHPVCGQGHLRHRRCADLRPLAHLHRSCPRQGLHGGRAPARGWRDPHR